MKMGFQFWKLCIIITGEKITFTANSTTKSFVLKGTRNYCYTPKEQLRMVTPFEKTVVVSDVSGFNIFYLTNNLVLNHTKDADSLPADAVVILAMVSESWSTLLSWYPIYIPLKLICVGFSSSKGPCFWDGIS